MKIIGLEDTDNLGNQDPEMVSLYKELLIKSKEKLYVMSLTAKCFRLIPVNRLHPGPRSIIMRALHDTAIAGKHI